MRRAWLLLLVAVAAGRAGAAGSQVDFELKVSPTAGTVNDEFIVTVQQTIHGVNSAERYFPPDFADWTVLDQRSQQ